MSNTKIKSNYTDKELKEYDPDLDLEEYEVYLLVWIILPIVIFLIVSLMIYSMSTNRNLIMSGGGGLISALITLGCIYGFQVFYYDDKLEEMKEKLTKDINNEKRAEQELAGSDICIKDNQCKNDSVCNSYGPNLQQYNCSGCPAEWTGKNCDEVAPRVKIDERCLKENGDKIPNVEYCNTCEHDGECIDDIKWQNGKLVNPSDCVGDEFCKCVHNGSFTIDCPYNRDGDINELYNPYGCNVLNHEVWCPMSAEDNKPKCVIRNYPINAGEDCADSVIGQSGLCHDIYGKHNSYWSDRKMKCIIDCDDGEVYNYHKDKCEYYDDTCGNLKEKDTCKGDYCKWNDNKEKCEISDEKHCISMNEDKCIEHGGRCEWKKVGKGNHKHHACGDKASPQVPPVAPVPPVALVPPVAAPSSNQDQDFRIKKKKGKKHKKETFIVGGYFEI